MNICIHIKILPKAIFSKYFEEQRADLKSGKKTLLKLITKKKMLNVQSLC